MPDSLPVAARPLLADLAHYAASIEASRIPPEVRRQAALCLLDTIGCILAGAATPEAAMLLAAEGEDGAGSARILGSDRRLAPEAAARFHGYAGDVFELNDLIGGHASIGNVAAVLAAAGGAAPSGARLLTALTVGIEVTCRVYASVYPHLKPYTEVAMVTPGIVSAIGAAAAVAVLQEQPEHVLREALAIAGTLATWCPAEAIFGDGGTAKPLLFGAWPAAVGLRAVRYARQGMTGPGRLLESGMGLFATLGRRYDPETVTDTSRWYLREPRRKLHACCGYIHSALDGVVALRHELGVAALREGRLRVGLPAYVIPAVSKGRPPATPNEARFHAEYALALAVCGEDVILPGHSLNVSGHLTRGDLQDVMRRITVVADPELSHYHQSTLQFEDGPRRSVRKNGAPKGSPQNPMSEAEVIEKFVRIVPRPGTGAYSERILTIESCSDCNWIFDDIAVASRAMA